jgi:hypothetical protein
MRLLLEMLQASQGEAESIKIAKGSNQFPRNRTEVIQKFKAIWLKSTQ